ncbi:MAG TPA: hypothetical protein DEB24_01130, partial [Coriobacteriia bacterium]|nr:hypothetical protein [Coriobacteriia bacterium]
MKIQQQSKPAERKPQSEFYVRCPFGLEKAVASEIAAMGIKGARPLSGGVAFFGDLEKGYRACLWLRSASRVLLVLGRFSARNADELYGGARAIAWETHLTPESTFAVYARGTNDELRNTQFTALRVKDALCDCFVELAGKRPNVATDRPDIRVELSLRGNKATLYLDLSGEPLHRREYRRPGVQGEAPLKENLAAGILLMSGWKAAGAERRFQRFSGAPQSAKDPVAGREKGSDSQHAAQRSGTASQVVAQRPDTALQDAASPTLLFDPICGSGTLVLEAACMTFDRAPGLTRDYWGFNGWLGHDQAIWDELLDEADRRFEAALAGGLERGAASSDQTDDTADNSHQVA